MEKTEFSAREPRRKFFARLMSGIAGAAALLCAPKRASSETKRPEPSETAPILYHRTEESERYYRTLHR